VTSLPTPMRVVPGKLVVSIVPARAPNKGDAVLDLRSRERADIAIYVGDDATDEDVFRIDQPGRLLGIRIGEAQNSAAAYFLRSQREVDRLLRRLVDLGKRRDES
jgi:trehalose 6-phosphate phosphatase